jgi:S1-C subfamily serine protease
MPSLAAVVKRIAPSVVTIEGRGRVAAAPSTTRGQAGKGIGPVLGARDEIRTFGSGVVFDARRGLIITNSHVIDHADEITVKLTDGRALPARRVGADPETEAVVSQYHRAAGRGRQYRHRSLNISSAHRATWDGRTRAVIEGRRSRSYGKFGSAFIETPGRR